MIEVSIDWIEWTSNSFADVKALLAWLNYEFDDFLVCDRPKYGYAAMIKHYDYPLLIMYAGREDMGIHLSASGRAVDRLADQLQMDDLTMICHLHSMGKFSRLDIAIDDFGAEFYKVPDVARILKRDRYRTRFRNYTILSMYDTDNNNKVGDTVYLGRRASGSFIRVYDKRLEHDFKLPDEPPQVMEQTRWELELKGDSAENAVKLIYDRCDIRAPAAMILNSCWQHINKDDDRKTRCTVTKKFENFVGTIEKAKIGKSKKILTIDQKKDWLRDSCSKTMAIAYSSDPEYIQNCVEYGMTLLSDKELNALLPAEGVGTSNGDDQES